MSQFLSCPVVVVVVVGPCRPGWPTCALSSGMYSVHVRHFWTGSV